MKTRFVNNLLVFSLFGVALYFFGILYEGIVYGPKLLDTSVDSMRFWKNFTSILNPLPYYVPWVYLATITLIILYYQTDKAEALLKKRLRWATVSQCLSLALTIYILTQINFKQSFGNLAVYATTIPGKVMLFNILSVCRIGLGAISLVNTFRATIVHSKESVA